MIRKSGSGELKGDEIDLKMFEYSQSTLEEKNEVHDLCHIINKGNTIEVLRVNQFESRHKSMSVLVKNLQTQEVMVFVKGAPELIYESSLKKCQDTLPLVEKLSLEGYRTIGFGYKLISEAEV